MTSQRARAWLVLHLVEGCTWLAALLLGAIRFHDMFTPDWFGGEVSQLTAAALLFSAARLRMAHSGDFGAAAMSGLSAVGAVVLLFWPALGASMAKAWAWALGVPFLVGWAMHLNAMGWRQAIWRVGGWICGWAGLLVWGGTHGWVEPVWPLPTSLAQAGFHIRTSGAVEHGTPAPFGDHFISFSGGHSPLFCWHERLPKTYRAKDIVSRNGPLYRCLKTHEARLDFDADAQEHWDLVLRPTQRQREAAPPWAPGDPGDCARTFDRAFDGGMRFSVLWLAPVGEQAIVQLERFRGPWAVAVGMVWLILGIFTAGFQSFRASLQTHA